MNTQANSNPTSSNDAGFPPAPPETHQSSATQNQEQKNKGKDIKQEITNKIIELLEKGGNQQKQRWVSAKFGMPVNADTGVHYNGINVVLLLLEMMNHSYAENRWLTFKQAQSLGGTVRKGEHGVMCCFFSNVEKKGSQDEPTTEGNEKSYFPMIKTFWLFNLAQIDGLPDNVICSDPINKFNPIERADALLLATGANIQHGYRSAYFSLADDKICLPDQDKFTSRENYYATLLHELTHWTGHKSRIGREFGARYGDESYAFEELIAELGAAFLNAELGFVDALLESHASYIDHWLKILKRDKNAIFTASKQATLAFNYVMQCSVNAAMPERIAA